MPYMGECNDERTPCTPGHLVIAGQLVCTPKAAISDIAECKKAAR